MRKFYIIISFCCFNLTIFSQVNADSLWAIWKDSSHADIVRLKCVNQLSKYISSKNYPYPDSLFYYTNEFLLLARKLNDKKEIVSLLMINTNRLQLTGNHKKSLNVLLEAFKLSKELKNNTLISNCELSLANSYNEIGDLSKALYFYLKSIKLKDKLKEFRKSAIIRNNIALVYKQNKDSINELKYYNESLNIANKFNYLDVKALANANIGVYFKDHQNYDSAFRYFDEALTYYKEDDSPINAVRMAIIYFNISQSYTEQNKYVEAINFIKKSKELLLGVNHIQGLIKCDVHLGNIFFSKNKPYEAIEISKNAYLKAVKLGVLIDIKNASKVLYKSYKLIKNDVKALEMFEVYINAKDSIKILENTKSVINQQYQYEYEKKSLADSIKHQDEIIIHQAEAKAEEEKRKAEEEKRKNQEFILYGVIALLILIVAFSFYLYTRFRLIRRQRNLINEQKKTVDKAYGELGEEKKKVERKNKQIITSINYAKKIQQAILPEDELMQTFFTDHFVLFQPKDIVGGDFYWYRCFGDIAVIACVDCTGHGVPGGFMSMMGSLLLDKIVSNTKLSPSEILGQLSNEIIRVLKQETGGEIQDGMDLSLCIIDKKNKALHFSGARNGIYLIEDKEIKSFKADMLPAGGSFSKKSKEMNRSFTSQTIKLKENSWIMMYSDGFCDQLGGDKMMSMGNVKFEEMLQKSILQKELRQEYLMDEFNKWKGAFPQVDDLLIIGLQV